MGDDRGLTVGGPDPMIMDWQWVMHIHCPWKLSEEEFVFISSEDEASYPRVAARLSRLPGVSVVGVEPADDNGLLFVLSDGSELAVRPLPDSRYAEPYRIHIWGGTLVAD